MRKLFIIPILLVIAMSSIAQFSPVSWDFSAKKISDKTYELTFKAKVNSPWHIYSQYTPDGGPLPTKISFNKNPLVKVEGEAKESGKIIKKYEDVFEVDVKYFDGDASFILVVRLKNNVKTNLSGTVEFMACNDEQCMPPATVPFTISLQ